MTKPKFSVCMCVYFKDNPEWFDTAVQSVLNQTVPPAEVVLVVDGPVGEDLDTVIQKYEKLHIFQVIRLKENGGLGNARRVGLATCSHELVAMMDADDICVLNRFERQVQVFFENKNVDIVGAYISEFVDSPVNCIAKRVVPVEDSAIKEFMKRRNPMNHMTVMCKKASVLSAGGYLDWHYHEDYYLWVRMAIAGMRFANVPEVLVHARVGADMYRRRGGWKCFKSGAKLIKYMYAQRFIGVGRLVANICERFTVQVLLPNRLRGCVFQKFARKSM